MTVNDKGIEAGGESPAAEDVKAGTDPGAEPKKVEIEVNGNKVEMLEGPASGLEIKQAAIKQGVGIKRTSCSSRRCRTGPLRSLATMTRSLFVNT